MKSELFLKGIFVAGIAYIPIPHQKCSTTISSKYFNNGKYCATNSEHRRNEVKKEQRTNSFNRKIWHDKNLILQQAITEIMYANAITFIAGAY